jgi:peptidoglycan-associated lipoprotein
MNRLSKIATVLTLGVIVGFTAGCPDKKPVTKVEPTPVPAGVSTPTVVTVETPVPPPGRTPRVDSGDINIKGKTNEELGRYLNAVFFDFDKYDVRADQRDVLAADAAWLQKYPSVMFTIEGHCDERGTREYNLALGDKRANAAKDYLVSLGVSASRIKTVSYGKERPFNTGHDEDSWAKNRRAHFVVTAR